MLQLSNGEKLKWSGLLAALKRRKKIEKNMEMICEVGIWQVDNLVKYLNYHFIPLLSFGNMHNCTMNHAQNDGVTKHAPKTYYNNAILSVKVNM
jgi:hypothetical protein